MTSKLRLIFLLGSICLSVQRQVRDEDIKDQQDIEKLVKLIGNLKRKPHSHSDEEHHHNDHHAKDHANLMNIQTLNMFYKNKDKKQADSDTDLPAPKAPKHARNSHESKDEIEELLNELERELNKNDDDTKLRCNSKNGRCGGHVQRCGCNDKRAGTDKTLRCRTCSVDRADRERSVQRCRGKRCGRSNNGDTGEDIDAVEDESSERRSRNDRSEYRCRGNRCGRSRNVEGNYDFDSLSTAKSGKKFRINDDLDAIVLDLSDLDGLLNKYGDCKDGKCREKREMNKQNLAVVENVDLNNLIDNVNSHDNVEAIFIDLSQVENSEDLANYIKKKFSSNAKNNQKFVKSEDLFNYYTSLKKEVIDLILSYMLGEVTLNKLNFLPHSVKQKVYNLKHQLQGVAVSENQLRNEINRIVFERGDSKVVPHGEKNNNIYVPKWLHTAVVNAVNNYNLRAQKSLFPLTSKQRLKLKKKSDLWRRTSKADVEARGIPFELKVQGLGQVAP